jgi:hypothetical protein
VVARIEDGCFQPMQGPARKECIAGLVLWRCVGPPTTRISAARLSNAAVSGTWKSLTVPYSANLSAMANASRSVFPKVESYMIGVFIFVISFHSGAIEKLLCIGRSSLDRFLHSLLTLTFYVATHASRALSQWLSRELSDALAC